MGWGGYNYTFFLLLTWLPTYLSLSLHLNLLHSVLYTSVPWLVGTTTDLVIGGWMVDALLKRAGAGQVFLTGLTTSQAVESTARSAYERNYNVVVVTDAIGDLDTDAHTNSVDRIFPKLAELATTEEVLAQL